MNHADTPDAWWDESRPRTTPTAPSRQTPERSGEIIEIGAVVVRRSWLFWGSVPMFARRLHLDHRPMAAPAMRTDVVSRAAAERMARGRHRRVIR